MNINAKFLKEAKEWAEKWEHVDFSCLEGMMAKEAKDLECQRLHNETGTWDCCEECKEKDE